MEVTDKRVKRLDAAISTLVKKTLTETNKTSTRKKWTYADFLSDKMLIIQVIRKGVPYSLFALIKQQAPFSETEWASYLDIHTKSLQRYEQANTIFKPIHSEKIIEMAEVTRLGLDVFGDTERFKLWLQTPSFALGNMKPVELLTDSYGKEMVMGELTRINYGILA